MRGFFRLCWVMAVVHLLSAPAPAQQQAPASAANAVAATVNGEAIFEKAVQRGLQFAPPDKHAEARPEILNVLIDNTLVSQYLTRSQVTVDKNDVDARINEARAQLKNDKAELEKMLKQMMMTEDELRTYIANELRWEKHVARQATEQALRELFDKNREIFDGSMVRARHILLTPKPGDARASEAAQAELIAVKKQVEAKVAAGLAELKPTADNLEREKQRVKLIEEAFSAIAKEKSACPSRAEGGDVGWFARAGNMVEPFAKAAFALQPYQMSDVVTTQFGHHLLLVTGRKPGKDAKFDDANVKQAVTYIFGERLREALCAQLRQGARIVINPPPK